MSDPPTKVYCAFCARESSEVWRLVKADGATICDICVDIANGILAEERVKEREANAAKAYFEAEHQKRWMEYGP